MKEKKTILIIEDEKSLSQALGDKFASEGFDILIEDDGAAGLTTALEKKPNIILLDIIMPVLGGMEMLEQLRKDAWGKDVPVIILTNLTESDTTAKGMNMGVYDFYIKSDWKIADVVEKVKEKLDS